ncbi:MAG: alpha/beta fold hydrolase [Polyangia bacterium]
MIAAGLILTVAAAIAPLPHTRSGSGPALVLVHGLGGDRHTWDDVTRVLEKSFTVIAVDLPGHGAAAEPASFDADRIAAQILATVRAEKISRAIFVGHSLGGFILAHLSDPQLVRAIVLVDIGIGSLWPDNEIAEVRAKLAKDREATLRELFGPISRSAAQLERLLPGLRKLPDKTILGYAGVMGKQPTPGAKLPRPALLMASKLILTGNKPRSEDLAAVGFGGATDLRVVRFDESMHWLFWDEPAKFLATLGDFARTVAP